MARSLLVLLGMLFPVFLLGAQDLGRTERLWRIYLSETVRRGAPLLAYDALPGVVPFWPAVTRARLDAETLEPGADTTLLGAWIDRAESRGRRSVAALQALGNHPRFVRWPSRFGAEALFALWEPQAAPREWTDAWLGWSDKAYSPRGLLLGLETFESLDETAVVPLLRQALALYPEDRRFLRILARHPEADPSTAGLISRDLTLNGGWSNASLRKLLDRQPSMRALLLKAGYTETSLDSARQRNYGAWLLDSSGSKPTEGGWDWDSDADGTAETQLVFSEASLASWSRRTAEGVWTLSLRSSTPEQLVERRVGASWTLRWEAYPLVSSLEYHSGNRTLVYRFRPLSQPVALWPAERLQAPAEKLPAVLSKLWLPLDPRSLAASAATVETWEQGVKIDTVFLYRGEIWLEIEDSNRDGIEDRWSYFRAGLLWSVYSDAEGRGQADLRELYRRGELVQVQSRAATNPKIEFVLFPQEGVQLWDPHGDRRPLERLFVWSGDEKLGALVFSKEELPWETMPLWEARP